MNGYPDDIMPRSRANNIKVETDEMRTGRR